MHNNLFYILQHIQIKYIIIFNINVFSNHENYHKCHKILYIILKHNLKYIYIYIYITYYFLFYHFLKFYFTFLRVLINFWSIDIFYQSFHRYFFIYPELTYTVKTNIYITIFNEIKLHISLLELFFLLPIS